jgi:hypothetical protein
MKSIIFWDTTPCSPLSANRRFGGTHRLHLQGRRNKFSKKPASKKVASFLLNLFLLPWRWRLYVPPKRLLTPDRLYGVISQKMVLFFRKFPYSRYLLYDTFLPYISLLRICMTYVWRCFWQRIMNSGTGMEGVKWSHLALDEDQWRTLVKTFAPSGSI